MGVSRRRLLQAGGGIAAASLLGATGSARAWGAGRGGADGLRRPGSLPDFRRPMGMPDVDMPFDHVVIVMMENHSFDNYFGMLPRRGVPAADGFRFDAAGAPLDMNPGPSGPVRAFRATTTCQPYAVDQAWTPTHRQIDGGAMDGFVATSGSGAMSYCDEEDLPFYYSLARSFTVADRWFCSAPCETYPNRRFLVAGTAYGLVSTTLSSFADPPPANGTIVDRLVAAGLSFKNYFTDLPSSAIVPSIIERHPGVLSPLLGFFVDCATGNLPQVALVDPDYNVIESVVEEGEKKPDIKAVEAALGPRVAGYIRWVRSLGASEEKPVNVSFGESFVAAVVNAVLHSPAWSRTLLIWTYDEHGGYYDHVPPPAAIAPDDIAPVLKANDVPGGYDLYGPRVPAVIVSPYARPGSVVSEIYDHTSVLATIEAKWNLPALTYRDANANTVMGALDLSQPPRLHPPVLAPPGDSIASSLACPDTPLPLDPQPSGPVPSITHPLSTALGKLGL